MKIKGSIYFILLFVLSSGFYLVFKSPREFHAKSVPFEEKKEIIKEFDDLNSSSIKENEEKSQTNPQQIDLLIVELKDKKSSPLFYRKTQKTLIELGRKGDLQVLYSLENLLYSIEEWEQQFAVTALLSIANGKSLSILMSYIDSLDEWKQKNVLKKIARIHHYQINRSTQELAKVELEIIQMIDSRGNEQFYSELISSLLGFSLPTGLKWAVSQWDQVNEEKAKALKNGFSLIYKDEVLPVLRQCMEEREEMFQYCGAMVANIGSAKATNLLLNLPVQQIILHEREYLLWLGRLSQRDSLDVLLNKAKRFEDSKSELYIKIKQIYEKKINELNLEVL